jgi:hypothetical protein
LKRQDLLVRSPAEPASRGNKPAESGERRKGMRFAVSASADILELRTHTRLSGRASDLGAGGCYIDTVTPFPIGTTVVLNLTSENHNVHAMANVVYAHTGMGMGLAFSEMTPTQQANLSSWLRELAASHLKLSHRPKRTCLSFKKRQSGSQLPIPEERPCSTHWRNLCRCCQISECSPRKR